MRGRPAVPGAARRSAGVAIVASAIEAYTDEVELQVTRLLETAHGGRPQAQHKPGRAVEVKLRGTAYQVSTLNTGPSRYQVTVTGGGHTTTVEAELDRLDEFHRRLVVGGRRHHVVTSTYGPTTLVEVDGIAEPVRVRFARYTFTDITHLGHTAELLPLPIPETTAA